MKRSDLTDEEILAKIEEAEQNSYGINDAELTADREEALRFYNGENVNPAPEGRSQVVSRDVLDVVESALPQLLKMFVSGDEVVRFEARGPEDEDGAEQETAAVNYFTMEKNDGYRIFYVWFKDALLSKNGYVKVWFEEQEETETENYKGLTDDQLALLLQDERITVIEHTAYPDPVALEQIQQAAMVAQQNGQPFQMPPEPMLHDVKIEIKDTVGCIEIDNVAPEDMLIGHDTKTVSLQEANFVQHRALMTPDEVEENGWKVPEGALVFTNESRWEESQARDLYDENGELVIEKYLVKDTYFRVSGELKRYVVIGNTIVHTEDCEIIPFACITPHIMPHRHIGMSYADLTKDVQLIKSTLIRGQLDSMYLALQPRFAVSDRVNLSDMLVSRPGGVVRTQGDPGTAILPLQSPSMPPMVFSLVEYLDRTKATRTGISEQQAGVDANALNKTAMQANILQNNAMERLALVARTFANTGVKELFMLVHRLVRKNYTRPEIIRLRKEWVTVDPREWKERKDMSVAVGLGTGNKDQQLAHLQTILMAQKESFALGIASPKNIYNALKKLTINAGFKSPEEFWTDPDTVPPKPPQDPPEVMIKKMELQADQQKFQAEAQLKQAEADKKAELDIQKFQAQAEIDRRQAEQQMQQELARSSNDIEIERQKIVMEAELERYKAELKAQTDIQIAQIQAEIEARQQEREAIQAERESQRQMEMHKEKIDAMTRAKTIVRDENGRPAGIQ